MTKVILSAGRSKKAGVLTKFYVIFSIKPDDPLKLDLLKNQQTMAQFCENTAKIKQINEESLTRVVEELGHLARSVRIPA